jgi:hypothetical protein
MKIDKVIFTIDDNPHYKGFWSSVSKHYKQRIGINPTLIIIGDKSKIDIESYDISNGEVIIMQQIENIPTIIQALIGKFYFTKLDIESTWLIGDLDLYPLQQFHFKSRIQNINENSYVHLNPYAYGFNWRLSVKGLAGYFHVAKGKIFEQELKFVNKTFEDVCLEIYNSNKYGIKFHGMFGNNENKKASADWEWFCCEEMYTGELLKTSNNLIELPPIGGTYPRIDRSNMIYDIKLLENGGYIDFHAPRPYEEYSDIIESIISKIPQS